MLTLQRKAKMSLNFEKKLAFIFTIGLLSLIFSSIFNSGQDLILTLFFNSSYSLDSTHLNQL
jgi:uncharacterized membrane protein